MAAESALLVVLHASAMRTSLVTGANRGIGLEYCRQLKARGDEVVAVCREPGPELEALGVRIEAGVELTDTDAVAALMLRLACARPQHLLQLCAQDPRYYGEDSINNPHACPMHHVQSLQKPTSLDFRARRKS